MLAQHDFTDPVYSVIHIYIAANYVVLENEAYVPSNPPKCANTDNESLCESLESKEILLCQCHYKSLSLLPPSSRNHINEYLMIFLGNGIALVSSCVSPGLSADAPTSLEKNKRRDDQETHSARGGGGGGGGGGAGGGA